MPKKSYKSKIDFNDYNIDFETKPISFRKLARIIKGLIKKSLDNMGYINIRIEVMDEEGDKNET